MLVIHMRLLPATFALCCLVLIPTLILRPPLPDFGNGFALCDVPCWAGIEPGHSRYDDVPAALAAHLPDTEVSPFQQYMVFHTPDAHLVGVLGERDGYVNSIRLNVAQPLWATLLLLGAPRCIQYIDRQITPHLVNIIWAIDDVHVLSNVNLSGASTVVATNTLQLWVSPPPSPCLVRDNIAPWPGYAALK